MVVVYGWILLCSMFCCLLCAAFSGVTSLAVRWIVCSGVITCYIVEVCLPVLLLAMLFSPRLESCCLLTWIWIFTAAFWFVSIWLYDVRAIRVYGLSLHTFKAKYQDFFTLRLFCFFIVTVFMPWISIIFWCRWMTFWLVHDKTSVSSKNLVVLIGMMCLVTEDFSC